MDKEEIKQMIFDFMYSETDVLEEAEQINFSNYFEKWWKNYSTNMTKFSILIKPQNKILRENKTLTFNPEIYKSYKKFLDSNGKIASRDLEKHMIRTLNNAIEEKNND